MHDGELRGAYPEEIMANRNFPASRIFGNQLMPVRIRGQAAIGATGAPTLAGSSSGPTGSFGIKSITRLAAGVYRLQLDDNYSAFSSFNIRFQAPVTGAAVAGGAFVATTVYQIVTLGTTTQAQWVTAGLPAGITAAVGQVFVAAGVGAGTGTVKALGPSNIITTEVIGPQSMLSNQPFVQGNGGAYITFQCLGATATADTALIPTDPANGSTMLIELIMNNSSIQ